MDYLNTGARQLCGAGVNTMDLIYAKALRLTFWNVYTSVTLIELLTYLVHNGFVVFPWIWNTSLRVWPLGEEGGHC